MTRLQEEIKTAMEKADRESSKRFTSEDYANAAAEVAKRYIELAIEWTLMNKDNFHEKDYIHLFEKAYGVIENNTKSKTE
jgi:hypothetical protein